MLAATHLAGCANGQLDTKSLTINAVESIPAAPLAILEGNRIPKGTPIEIYTRIARGAHGCWLGGPLALRKTHKFHAAAVPEQQGGNSKIVIFERPRKGAPNLKGLQAFRIIISPQGVSAHVEAQNLRFPDEIGKQMVLDTHRWASGEEGCVDGGVREGWAATTAAQDPAKKKRKKK